MSHRIFNSADEEVLSDSYKCKVIDGVLYEVEGKVSRPRGVLMGFMARSVCLCWHGKLQFTRQPGGKLHIAECFSGCK